jgi:hypothetical protein
MSERILFAGRWRGTPDEGTIEPMARCALCTFPATHGHLCEAHRKAILPVALTSEQLTSRQSEGLASLIDPWGTAWVVASRTLVGRSLDECDLTVLHPSVSLLHAVIERREDGSWQLTDKESRNGTFIDGAKIQSTALAGGARIRFGEVTLYFVDRALPRTERPEGPGRTAPSRRDQLIFTAALRASSGARVELSQRVEGGVVRVNGTSVDLGKLEFRLLQVLAEARRDVKDLDHAYVPWPKVAEQLDFRSYEADSENVRELVRRVRRKLQQAGSGDLIESKHGVGYRIAAAFEDA